MISWSQFHFILTWLKKNNQTFKKKKKAIIKINKLNSLFNCKAVNTFCFKSASSFSEEPARPGLTRQLKSKSLSETHARPRARGAAGVVWCWASRVSLRKVERLVINFPARGWKAAICLPQSVKLWPPSRPLQQLSAKDAWSGRRLPASSDSEPGSSKEH